MLRLLRSKIYLAIFLMVTILAVGVFGYHFLSDFSWTEALYMTIITVSTVVLIMASIFIFAFAISVITEYILNRNSLQILKKKKVKQQIDRLENHVIVCGFGRNGSQAAARLKAYKRPFVVIEKDREIIEKYEEDILFVEGDANEDEVVMAAGVERARYLITTLPEDAANLFVVLSARQLNKDLFIISRASQITSQKKLQLAGANKVIMPDKIGGDHMASLVVLPDLITFMDKLSLEGEHTTNLEEVQIEDFTNQLHCNTLRDLDLRKKTGCTIIGYVKPDGTYIINPEADMPLEPNSKVIVLGRADQIRNLNQMFHIGKG